MLSPEEQERANQLKEQDLVNRERKLEDESQRLSQERLAYLEVQRRFAEVRGRNIRILMMVFVVVAIGAGYFAFNYMDKKERYFEQIVLASKNIDKLTKVLSLTQDEVLSSSSALVDKKNQLKVTKTMLTDLKTATEQLHQEINQMKNSQANSEAERNALLTSAQALSSQLKNLKVQLEDNDLTNDINEAFIAYQENDLRNFQKTLAEHYESIQSKEQSLEQKQSQLLALEQTLAQKDQKIAELTHHISELNTSLTQVQDKYQASQASYASLEQEVKELRKAPKH